VVERDPTDGDKIRRALALLRAQSPQERAAMAEVCARVVTHNGAAECARVLLSSTYDDDQLAWATGLVPSATALELERQGRDGLRAIAHWLPTLLPQGRWSAVSRRPAFLAVLDQLPRDVADVVAEIAEQAPDDAALRRFQHNLDTWIALASRWPGGLSHLIGLVDVAVKRHPLQQEAHGQWARWMADLLGHLRHAMTDRLPAGWTPRDLELLFHAFPAIVDADLAASFAWWATTLEVVEAAGVGPTSVLASLRGLEARHHRLHGERLGQWLKAPS